jgi:sugar/nucleoside kinase (ribokinase family)
MFDFVTIGSATRDIMYRTGGGVVVPKFDKCGRRDSLAFTLGSKFEVEQAFFNYGGGANNTAVALAKLGFKVATIMAIGGDDFGRGVIQHLKKEKVATSLIQVIKKGSTGLSAIISSTQDRRHILFVNRAANQKLTFSVSKYKNLKTKWLYLNSLNFFGWKKNIQEIIKYKIQNPQTKIHWNPGKWQIKGGIKKIRKILRLVEVLQVNREEAKCLIDSDKKLKIKCKDIRSQIKIIHSLGPKMVVITDGIKGVYCYDGKKLYKQKASNDKPVDTTGAGDSFGSGFVGGLNIFKGDIAKALKAGITNAGSVVSQCGAQNGLLGRREVLKRIT